MKSALVVDKSTVFRDSRVASSGLNLQRGKQRLWWIKYYVGGQQVHHSLHTATWTTIEQAEAGWPGKAVTGIALRASDGLLAVTTQTSDTNPYTGGASVREGAIWTSPFPGITT